MKTAATATKTSLLSFLFSPHLFRQSIATNSAYAMDFAVADGAETTSRTSFQIKTITSLSMDALVFQNAKKCACTAMLYNLDDNIFYVADRDDLNFSLHNPNYLEKLEQYVAKIKATYDAQELKGAFGYLLMSDFRAMAELGENPDLIYGVYLSSDETETSWQKLKDIHFNLRALTSEVKASHF